MKLNTRELASGSDLLRTSLRVVLLSGVLIGTVFGQQTLELFANAAFETAVWRDTSGGQVPSGALATGVEENGAPTFTCRAKPPNQDNLELGKLTAGFRGCAIGYYGASLSVETYQVLMSYSTRWVNATGTGLPAHAVEGGARPDGVAEYVCRATPPGARGLHPGKRSDRTCDVEFRGREYNVEKFQVLTYPWTRARRGAIPARAFQASSDVDGSPLYPCRGQHLGGLHLGKVGTHLQGCLIESFGRSVLLPAYEVLTSFAGNWVAGFGSSSPDNGFIGGIEFNPEGPGTLDQYVCRAIPPGAGNTKHPGKFVPRPLRPNSGRCWVEFGHSGYTLDAYEVLVPTNARFSPR